MKKMGGRVRKFFVMSDDRPGWAWAAAINRRLARLGIISHWPYLYKRFDLNYQ